MEGRAPLNDKIEKENPDMRFIVRLYDGFDNEWIDVTEPISLSEARNVWKERTKDGTQKTEYGNIDYFDIYPEDTAMYFTAEMRARRKQWQKN